MSHVITITRNVEDTKCTIGKLLINDAQIRGYTLERPGPSTTTSGLRKRIPAGTYQLQWHNSARFKMAVPNLFNKDVPAERLILIHPGNYPDDTDGCILAGTTYGPDFIGESVPKIKEIYKWIHEVGIENVTVQIIDIPHAT